MYLTVAIGKVHDRYCIQVVPVMLKSDWIPRRCMYTCLRDFNITLYVQPLGPRKIKKKFSCCDPA